jgi:hypothetical protein
MKILNSKIKDFKMREKKLGIPKYCLISIIKDTYFSIFELPNSKLY